MIVRSNILIILFMCSLGVFAQKITDSTKYSLLINPFIKIEVTEAINSMYNFEFKKANSHFRYVQSKYRWHPLPYLLIGLNHWWQIVPDYQNNKHDKIFLRYMDTAQALSKNLLKFNELEGAFFLAVTYAFKGRLFSERQQYRKAAIAGKNSLKYLGKCRGNETYSPELLFGDALLNYYREWIKEEYPYLRPILWFFPSGNKELGISQLKEVARNSFYTRIEAQYYLIKILSLEKSNLNDALHFSESLHKVYPNNPYFELEYTKILYQTGRYTLAQRISQSILQKIDSNYNGYGVNTGRKACFFLGHINQILQNYDKSKNYYLRGLTYSRAANATRKGYHFYSLLNLGKLYQQQNNNEKSKQYFKQVIKITKNKHPANKEAKKRLSEL